MASGWLAPPCSCSKSDALLVPGHIYGAPLDSGRSLSHLVLSLLA